MIVGRFSVAAFHNCTFSKYNAHAAAADVTFIFSPGPCVYGHTSAALRFDACVFPAGVVDSLVPLALLESEIPGMCGGVYSADVHIAGAHSSGVYGAGAHRPGVYGIGSHSAGGYSASGNNAPLRWICRTSTTFSDWYFDMEPISSAPPGTFPELADLRPLQAVCPVELHMLLRCCYLSVRTFWLS